ncbi:MAG: TRAP transporter small permease subunit [Pseudomonadota bacterium]
MAVRLLRWLEAINLAFGRVAAFAALALVLMQFALIIALNVFRIPSIWGQESLVYINALIFLGAGGYTLLKEAHVRVDLFYSQMGERARAIVNLVGVGLALIPFCILLWWFGIPYVVAAWQNLEGSRETGGIPAVFLLKSMVLVFTFGLTLQALVLAIRSLMTLSAAKPGQDASEPNEMKP